MAALKNGGSGSVVFARAGEKAAVVAGKKRRQHKAAAGESSRTDLEFQDEWRLLD
jgi:hypothetical protein